MNIIDPGSIANNFDNIVNNGLNILTNNGGGFFNFISDVLQGFYGAILYVLELAPWYILVFIVGLLGWRFVGFIFGVFVFVGLFLCWSMGLWGDTLSTFSLVFCATSIAVFVAVPLGILVGLVPKLEHIAQPALDLIQTLPPYVYLLPALALLGFSPATALFATLIVAIPPSVRLTALGIRMTDKAFIELGHSMGMTNMQMFFKIRLNFAIPSIMAGINQSLMLAFGMVVIAGIVGSGGLGQTIYDSIRTLAIGKSIDAAIAIVILTIIMDRFTQNFVCSESPML